MHVLWLCTSIILMTSWCYCLNHPLLVLTTTAACIYVVWFTLNFTQGVIQGDIHEYRSICNVTQSHATQHDNIWRYTAINLLLQYCNIPLTSLMQILRFGEVKSGTIVKVQSQKWVYFNNKCLKFQAIRVHSQESVTVGCSGSSHVFDQMLWVFW